MPPSTPNVATSAVFQAVNCRRSYSKVTALAPTRAQLLPLVAAAARVADHGALRPWRLLELRGDARERLGTAFVVASACEGSEAIKLAGKPLRAPLLIAVVAVRRANDKVADWEQDASAAGVAHLLTLLLDDAGWGAMWRTGPLVRSAAVRAVHDLADNEELLGWLYIGGIPADCKPGVRLSIDPADFLKVL
ncbi:nitroreductase family protein [Cryobacterium serini]|uniref:Putative NAD(P)H nitroreductase n=1 Tax=Cryobacterium serini TaxID=1259201 RepID=A0A4R9BL34_9MICO|nr:nitroreductase family protein [Cryobacterium serini]TFD86348.1 nitroreductase [Cryobacterium serini]